LAYLQDPLYSRDDAVKVVVRVRPVSDREADNAAGGGERRCLSCPDGRAVSLADPSRPEPFVATFDRVLDELSTQEDVYEAAGAAVVDHCIAGFNTSIFCYGQTGSGKTHTMIGVADRTEDGALVEESGLTLRVFEALFARISDEEQAKGHETVRYSVKCSFLEIYNEEISDLLVPAAVGLQIRDGDIKRGVYVQNLSETEVLNGE
jgi:kinesin family member 15